MDWGGMFADPAPLRGGESSRLGIRNPGQWAGGAPELAVGEEAVQAASRELFLAVVCRVGQGPG